jgi:hypothetical protein
MRILRLTISLLSTTIGASFHISQSSFTRYSTNLQISNLFNNNAPSTPKLPADVKEAVSKCRAAVQKGLEHKLSRMDVEFPVGTKFGVEKTSANKKKGGKLASAMADQESNANGVTKDMLETSDREVARLFVEMFQPVGGESISVVFSDDALQNLAAASWKGDPTASCRIMSITRGKKRKSAVKGMGGMGGAKKKKKDFAAKMNEEFDDESSGPFKVPYDCEVAIFVAPTAKDLIKIKQVCVDVGMGTLVILLNARLDLLEKATETEEFYQDQFEKVFYLSVAPQVAAPGCLMHRAYPSDWIVARKPKIGAPKTIATFESRPNEDDCKTAYDSIEIGDMEKGVENVLGNVASWLK